MLKEYEGTEGSVLLVPPEPPVSRPGPAVGSSQHSRKGIVPLTQSLVSPNQSQGHMDWAAADRIPVLTKELSILR